MIAKQSAFAVGERTFLKLEDAQEFALKELFRCSDQTSPAILPQAIVANREQVVNILTTKGTSHPAARKLNRKAKKPSAPAPEAA